MQVGKTYLQPEVPAEIVTYTYIFDESTEALPLYQYSAPPDYERTATHDEETCTL